MSRAILGAVICTLLGAPAEAASFEERWSEILLILPAEPFIRTVRTITIRPEPAAEPVIKRAARARIVRRAALHEPRQQGLCLRHRLRTIWHGRRWNCRR